MRALAFALLLAMAGCLAEPGADQGPGATAGGALTAGPDLAFAAPVTVIPSCGQLLSRCFEPSVAATPAGILAVNSYTAPFARSEDGQSFAFVPGPRAAAAYGSGGDALVQAAPDGSMWWSVLGQASLRVAHTPDAGLLWDRDVTVPLPSRPDRQWLTFGEGRMLMTYQGDAGVHAVSSTDGGQTWTEPVAVRESAHIHGLGTWCRGQFAVPLFDQGPLKLALSPDASQWTLRDVPGWGEFFPAVACTPDGLRVAWKAQDATLQVADSADGGVTWGPARTLSLPGETLSVSPMLLQDGDTTWAAYFTAASDGQPADLHVLRWRGGQVSRGVAVSGLAPVVAERPGNTDFPWLTLQDGRPLVAYADGRTVRLAAGANPERF